MFPINSLISGVSSTESFLRRAIMRVNTFKKACVETTTTAIKPPAFCYNFLKHAFIKGHERREEKAKKLHCREVIKTKYVTNWTSVKLQIQRKTTLTYVLELGELS